MIAIVGAGPTGMMLAAELKLAGCDAVVLERRTGVELDSPRSRGLHSRSLDMLHQRGIADRVIAAGTPMQVQAFGGIPLDISDFPCRHNHGLALFQSDFERILAAWLDELDVDVLRGHHVVGIESGEHDVRAVLDDGSEVCADYLVGCDGSRSVVREAAGIAFDGWDAITCWIHTEVEVDDVPSFGLRGGGGIGPADGGRVGVTLMEPDVTRDAPTIDDVRAALVRVDGTDYGARNPRFLARFTDATLQAVEYRRNRLLLAGDAAHVHAPFGGQGLNLGLQDAVNLGWKLALVDTGSAPPELLDSYHAERHPVAARVLQNTMAQRALGDDGPRTAALRAVVTDTLGMDEPRTAVGATVAGLDIHYSSVAPTGTQPQHPLVGRYVPANRIQPTRPADDLSASADDIAGLLRVPRGLVVVVESDNAGALGAAVERATTGWRDRIEVVPVRCDGPWRIPVLGEVAAPTALAVRPDGYVAWVGVGHDLDGLTDALTRWFGPPRASR